MNRNQVVARLVLVTLRFLGPTEGFEGSLALAMEAALAHSLRPRCTPILAVTSNTRPGQAVFSDLDAARGWQPAT
ncbi:MAG: hypothetical protein ACYCS9_09910 [Candidatus Dormibacteria bacterium]